MYNYSTRSKLSPLCFQFFRETAYLCNDRVDIMTAVQEFASQVTVLPPGSWDPKTRIEPPDILPTKVLNTW